MSKSNRDTDLSTDDLFVTCAGGVEPVLEKELLGLGFDQTQVGFRGVYVKADGLEAIYKINYCSRVASRVLLPLKRFRCYNSDSLYHCANSIDWMRYIPKGATFAIDANVSHKNLRNSLYAAQVFKDVICDQFREKTGHRPNVDTKFPDVQLNLFIHNELAVISFDTSGFPLHKRAYRQESVIAPLQESLAAAMLILAGYKGDEIFYDPCCGSGTFLIEAVLIATKTAPGYLRQDWGFKHLPGYSNDAWLKVKSEVDSMRIPLPKDLIFGTDINKDAIRITKTNLRAAGFGRDVEVVQYDFREYHPRIAPNFIISNPPHGKRLDDIDSLKGLYRSLGDFMKRVAAKPARGFIFTGSLELSKEVGLAPKQRHVLNNGGVESRLLEFDLY
jgi:putative N6-adenine-specific DNA methylase